MSEPLTPEQMKNRRNLLAAQVGVIAFLASDEAIHRLRDTMHARCADPEPPAPAPKKTPQESLLDSWKTAFCAKNRKAMEHLEQQLHLSRAQAMQAAGYQKIKLADVPARVG